MTGHPRTSPRQDSESTNAQKSERPVVRIGSFDIAEAAIARYRSRRKVVAEAEEAPETRGHPWWHRGAKAVRRPKKKGSSTRPKRR